jgi:hypothetical protein
MGGTQADDDLAGLPRALCVSDSDSDSCPSESMESLMHRFPAAQSRGALRRAVPSCVGVSHSFLALPDS